MAPPALKDGLSPLSKHYGPTLSESDNIHREKYRLSGESFAEAMTRVAGALADNQKHFKEFLRIFLIVNTAKLRFL